MKRLFQRPFAWLMLIGLLVTTGQGCGGGTPPTLPKVTLEYWRVFDDNDTFDVIFDNYKAVRPNVKIVYKKLRFDEYEAELVRAIAEGRGPDIVSLHNTWLPAYQDLLMPMPSSVTVVSQETQGTLRKEVVVVEKTLPTMSIRTLRNDYVEQVPEDVILPYQPDPEVEAVDSIYGLPLSVDTIALFYNKDLLDAAGISSAPTDWSTFQDDVAKLTQTDDLGTIIQSGAALGTSQNIDRASDILSLLMMQNGTEMTDARDRVNFQNIPDGTPSDVFPALDAVNFYTDFANPTKKVYTWNEGMPDSVEAFAAGKTAFFLGYSYHIPLIRTANPKLNFAIAPVPQIAGGRQVNFANYWVEGVTATSKNADWAWDFLLFAASEANVGSYLAEANKPTALRNLINTQLDNEDLSSFAAQTLTARSWYRGLDSAASDDAMEGLIDAILAGPEDPEDAVINAARKVDQTYKE